MTKKIAIFDSGVGGLSVLRHICTRLPHEDVVYFADQANVPYGLRSADEVRHFSRTITQFLIEQQAKIIVVACNTASAAALSHLRQTFPQIPIVGMEPAIKPAAEKTKNGKVGALATAVTFDSERYSDLMYRFAQNITVLEDPCIGLVDLIEAGQLDTAKTDSLLRKVITPMQQANIDTVVLGCTHYPFVQPLIEEILGTAVTIIDPAPAVAKQTHSLLIQHQQLSTSTTNGRIQLITSGEKPPFAQFAQRVLDLQFDIDTAVWHNPSHLKLT